MNKRKGKIEIIMKWWAKIISLIVVYFLISWIYTTIKIFFIPGVTPFWVYSMPFWWISAFIFYSPFFYYGWVKKPNDEHMKYFTKFMTVLYTIAVVFISPIFNGFSDIYLTIPVLALITPLYYYAWRKKK